MLPGKPHVLGRASDIVRFCFRSLPRKGTIVPRTLPLVFAHPSPPWPRDCVDSGNLAEGTRMGGNQHLCFCCFCWSLTCLLQTRSLAPETQPGRVAEARIRTIATQRHWPALNWACQRCARAGTDSPASIQPCKPLFMPPHRINAPSYLPWLPWARCACCMSLRIVNPILALVPSFPRWQPPELEIHAR